MKVDDRPQVDDSAQNKKLFDVRWAPKWSTVLVLIKENRILKKGDSLYI